MVSVSEVRARKSLRQILSRGAATVALAAGLMSAAGTRAGPVTLTFDDLPEPDTTGTTSSEVPNGYGGLTWINMGYLDVIRVSGSCCGYQNSAVSGHNIAYNGNAQDAAFAASRSFRLISFNMGSAYDNHVFEYVTGYDIDGNVVGSLTLDLSTGFSTLASPNWKGLRRVTFRNLQNTWFGMDNVVVNFAPETINLEQDYFTENDEAAQVSPSIFDGGTLRPTQAWTFGQAFTVHAVGGTIDSLNGDLAFTGDISGPGGLIVTGGHVVTLSGHNSYQGGTIVQSGTLSLQSSTAAGTGAITTRGSVIDYGNGVDIANAVILDSNHTQLNTAAGVTAAQSGGIFETNGARPLEKTGAGTLTFNGASTYSGDTTISGGTLILSQTGSLTSHVVVANGTAFESAGHLANWIANHGDFTLLGGQVTGGLSNDHLALATDGALDGLVDNLAGGVFTVGGVVTGNGGFGNASGATLAVNSGSYSLTGSISNSGDIKVVGGSLSASGIDNAAGGTITVSAGGTVDDDLANSGAVGNAGHYNADVANTGSAAHITNSASGVWTGNLTANAGGATVDNQGQWTGDFSNAATIDNTGTWTVATGGTNAAAFNNHTDATVHGPFTQVAGLTLNQGTIDGGIRVSGGELDTSGTLAGGIDNSAQVYATAGAVNGAIVNHGIGQFHTSGTVTGNGTFANSGTALLDVHGGSFSGLGDIINTANGSGGIAIAAGAALSGHHLDNAAGSLVQNAGTLTTITGTRNAGSLVTTGVVNGGLDNVSGGQTWAQGQVNGAITNAGTFTVTSGLTNDASAFGNAASGLLVVGGNAFTGIGDFNNDGQVSIGTASVNGRLGAAAMSNAGAVVLQNGKTGDRVDLTSLYSGGAVSTLSFDADMGSNAAISDRLSAASTNGTSTVSILNLNAQKIYFDQPIVLIHAGGGNGSFTASSDAQTQGALASNNVVDYHFRKIAGSNDWGIVSSLNTGPVASLAGHTAAMLGALDTGFFATADELAGDPGDTRWHGQLWLRAAKGGNVEAMTATASDTYSPVAEDRVRVGFDGWQMGAETQVSSVHLGITGGLTQSSARDTMSRTSIRAPFYGLYGMVDRKGLRLGLQVRHADLTLRPDSFLAGDIRLKGKADTVSASLALPHRVNIYTVAPFATYSRSAVSADPLTLSGGAGVLNFSNLSGTTEAVGVHLSAETRRGTTRLLPFVSLSEVRDVSHDAMTTFVPVGGAANVNVASTRMGRFTQVSGGLSWRDDDSGLESYVRGDARMGDRLNGYSFITGLRLSF